MTAPDRRWAFLTNHTRVLRAIAHDPQARLRAIAACEITERTVQAIVTDLEQAGYLRQRRDGRRNQDTPHAPWLRSCAGAHSNS